MVARRRVEVEVGELAHQDDVDEVLRARARLVAAVSAGVRVQLFGDVLFEGKSWDLDWVDVGECQEVRRRERVVLTGWVGWQGDVEWKVSNNRPARVAATRKR